MAEAATGALRTLLGEGDVTIFNIGPDKYSGRVVAEVATRRTGNVSTAMLAAGHARRYGGGHRNGWCDGREQIRKSGHRFSEKIMLKREMSPTEHDFNSVEACSRDSDAAAGR